MRERGWWVGLTVLLGCQDPTQITVQLSGRGFVCQADGARPRFEGAGIVARPQLGTSLDGPRAEAANADCAGADPVTLGSVVLVPSEGPGPVEVLVAAELSSADGVTNASGACLEGYARTLSGGALEADNFHPELCIFVRRSLAFVARSSLTLPIELSLECAGVVCEPSLTCEPGRGCVSSATSCEEDGSCAVDPGAGGAGAGSAGAGGGGGAGGAGGGGVWRSLDLPAGATPLDVVGATEVAGNGTTHERLYVAAGAQLLHWRDEAPSHIQQPNARAFVGVAVKAQGPVAAPSIVTIGEDGVRFSDNSFFGATKPPGWPASSVTGADFDVSWQGDKPNPYFAIDGGPGACLVVTDQIEGQADTTCGAALFSGATTSAVAHGSVVQVLGGSSVSSSTITSDDQSLWMTTSGDLALMAASLGNLIVPIGTNIVSTSATLTATPPKVDAVWGFDRGTGPVLYAVGVLDGVAWLGQTTIKPGDISFEWTTLEGPPTVTVPKSVWVGPEGSVDPKIVVVGDGGVAVARLAEVLPQP